MTLLPATFILRLAHRACTWGHGGSGAQATLAAARRALGLAFAVVLGGCAALPAHVERPLSVARHGEVVETTLDRVATASLADAPSGMSGFRLLTDGVEAWQTRLALIRTAEKTLDIQYYLIADDRSGREFLAELVAAATRGVRVRLLVDDLYATGQDALYAAVAAHANVEVRLFNPLPIRGGGVSRRVLLSLHELGRINHRMHNKLLIADGAFALSGGRNIGDEYFDHSSVANFLDVDVLSAGSIVANSEAAFDLFWNSTLAYPLQTVVDPASVGRIARTPSSTQASITADDPSAATSQAWAPLTRELMRGNVAMQVADAEWIADPPEKALAESTGTVAQRHLELIAAAKRSVLLASPYFVPGRAALAVLEAARGRDVAVTVITNSYRSTDEPIVHLAYARHRAELLRRGVELHELIAEEATAAEPSGVEEASRAGRSLGRLHGKLSVFDGTVTFIGSMNMDGRSANVNTESGLVIRSEALARTVSGFLEQRGIAVSYAVRVERGRLCWTTGERKLLVEDVPDRKAGLGARLLVEVLGEGFL